MDKIEKMDYRANGEAILWAVISLLSQGPKTSNPTSHRIESTLQVQDSESF